MRFRKKPVVIDAVQFKEYNDDEIVAFMAGTKFEYGNGLFVIPTLEGAMTAHPGDWLIRGVKGEYYPCKDDIFRATYEYVDFSAADWPD